MSPAEISVLLVDDDEMIRACIGDYLGDEGFILHVASSGEEALRVIAGISPVVCITDLRLSGMNGEEFIEQAHAICPETGYLLHTGMDYTLSDDLRAIGMTSDDVFLKPILDLSLLVKRIMLIASAEK